ncbi:MAG: hypothetical protein HY551_02185 [Elusimicrobia bacterium]|nr:hypothetical protein [Elusimicrobiota bacterium]
MSRRAILRLVSPPGAVLGAALLLQAWPAIAQSISFELRPSSRAVIGAPVEIAGRVRYPARFTLSSDLTGRTTGPFTILKAELGDPQLSGDGNTQDVKLSVVPFDLGSLTFPSLPWTLTDDSGKTETVKSPPVKLEVGGPSPDPGDIRDIKPPLAVTIGPWVVLALALAAAMAWAFWKRWISRRGAAASGATPAATDARPPYVIALEELGRLESSGLPAKEFYVRLSDILRVYLERRFGIPAPLLTTGDVLRQMREAELDRAAVGGSRELLERADLVKFAKFSPDTAQRTQDIQSAVRFVQATAPVPEIAPLSSPA